MPTRIEVFGVLNGERVYQEAQFGNAKRHEGQPPMTTGEHILCMQKCLQDAVAAWYKPDGNVTCLEYIRKVTAVGMACMELHGAPERVFHPNA